MRKRLSGVMAILLSKPSIVNGLPLPAAKSLSVIGRQSTVNHSAFNHQHLKFIIYHLSFIIFLCLPASSQPLSIGDRLPDVTIHHVLNAPVSGIRLSELKNTTVVLDFFATWCGACLTSLPHLDKLANEDTALLVIAVGYEPVATVNAFLRKHPQWMRSRIRFVAEDSLLGACFPHKLLPHTVCIGPDGRITAITKPQYITAGYIRNLKEGHVASLPLKQDQLHFNNKMPLLENGNGGNTGSLLYKSVITKHLAGLGTMAGQSVDTTQGIKRTYYINYPLLLLLKVATAELPWASRLIIKDTIPALTTKEDTPEWEEENTFCYEAYAPATTSRTQLKQYMLQDICGLAGLSITVEYKEIDCWLITANGPGKVPFVQTANHTGITLANWLAKLNRLQQNNQPVFSPLLVEDSILAALKLPAGLECASPVELLQYLQQWNMQCLQVKRMLPIPVLIKNNFSTLQ